MFNSRDMAARSRARLQQRQQQQQAQQTAVSPSFPFSVVPVPEFGEGMTVLIRPLTAVDNDMFNYHLDKNPSLSAHVLAALCCVDDTGALVFGKSRREAVEFLINLPTDFDAAVIRIGRALIDLTNQQKEQPCQQ